jgi:cellulose synthase/poly-beta-1,6-N-acetylglucosamine synthase-like glycosyltransferase
VELVARMHRMLGDQRMPYRVIFVGAAVCFTDPPHTIQDLGWQRTRWHQGLLTTLRLHARMLFRRRYGAVGLFAMPYHLAFELLAPVMEAMGWVALLLGVMTGLVTPLPLIGFLLMTIMLGSLVSTSSVLLDLWTFGSPTRRSDRLRLVACAFLEFAGYHQLTVYWRIRAFWHYYRAIHIRGGWISPRRQTQATPSSRGF